MKLATLDDGTRDGALCVVSRDLKIATIAYDVVPTLQAALDDWDFLAPLLGALYEQANQAPAGSRWFALDPAALAAPLPRAYQWLHARPHPDTPAPRSARKLPWLRCERTHALSGAHHELRCSADAAFESEAQLVAITDDVPYGVKRDKAGEHVRLLTLAHRLSQPAATQTDAPAEDSPAVTGDDAASRPAGTTAFSPVALTPDELGAAWDGRRLHLALHVQVNDAPARTTGAADQRFDVSTLLAVAAAAGSLGAGTLIGAGPAAGRDGGDHAHEPAHLRCGDRVRIEARDADGHSPFGAIVQTLADASGAPQAARTDAPPDTEAVPVDEATPAADARATTDTADA